MFTCKVCAINFVRNDNLKRHENIHKDIKFECFMCKKTFTRMDAVKRHLKNIHCDSDSPIYQCSKCNITFNRCDNLKRHSKFQHQHGNKNEKVLTHQKQCEADLTRKENLKQHIKSTQAKDDSMIQVRYDY